MSKNLRNRTKFILLHLMSSFSVDWTGFLTFNWRYLRFPWMDFDEKYLFGNVISCTFYDKNFTRKFYKLNCQIWLQSWNLLKIGRVHRNSWITLKFRVICWDIYYFSERLRCQLSNKPHKFKKLSPCKKFVKKRVLKALGTVPKNGFSQKRLLRFF
jgi:hypothetical protein